jgi:hypothetical protein
MFFFVIAIAMRFLGEMKNFFARVSSIKKIKLHETLDIVFELSEWLFD